MNSNLTMYGTMAGFRKNSGMIEHVVLGQVTKWGEMPNSMLGIGFNQDFFEEVAKKSGLSLKQYMDFYDGRHTRVEFAPGNFRLGEIEDGQEGAKILMQINGVIGRPTEKRTFWRKKLKNYESNADLKARVRNSESSDFTEIPYSGKIVISGPDYALKGFKEFLLEDCTSKEYKFNLVSKVQHMAFVSKY